MIIAKSANKFEVGKLLDLEWSYKECVFSGIIVGEKNPHGGFKKFQIFPFKGK